MTTTSTPIICSFKSKSGETGDDPLPYNDILMGDTNIDGLDGCEFPSATGGDPSPVNLNDQYNTILPDGYANEDTVGQERPRGLAHATTKLGSISGVYNECSSILQQTMLHEHGWPESTRSLCHWCCTVSMDAPTVYLWRGPGKVQGDRQFL
jgi:hypothetical protein